MDTRNLVLFCIVLVFVAVATEKHKFLKVPTIDAKKVSFDEFHNVWAKKNEPLIITNAMEDFKPVMEQGGTDFIREECGHRKLSDRCNFFSEDTVVFFDEESVGKRWGALEDANLIDLQIYTIADLLDEQARRAKSGETQLYLHDATLTCLCPALMIYTRMPKYIYANFSFMWEIVVLREWVDVEDPEYANSLWDWIGERKVVDGKTLKQIQHLSHPSLFIGPKASRGMRASNY
jgi:hypothetical protein